MHRLLDTAWTGQWHAQASMLAPHVEAVSKGSESERSQVLIFPSTVARKEFRSRLAIGVQAQARTLIRMSPYLLYHPGQVAQAAQATLLRWCPSTTCFGDAVIAHLPVGDGGEEGQRLAPNHTSPSPPWNPLHNR
eukprot:1141631-Pelagomonas_calceolata.AAC.2